MTKALGIAGAVCVVFFIIVALNRPPALTLTAKPDPRTQGNLGIGLSVRGVKALGQPIPVAHVRIIAPDGKVVLEAKETIDKFTFG